MAELRVNYSNDTFSAGLSGHQPDPLYRYFQTCAAEDDDQADETVRSPGGGVMYANKLRTIAVPGQATITEYRDPISGGVIRRTQTRDGSETWEYPGGERLTRLCDGTEIREVLMAGRVFSKTTTHPNGTEITEFSDGRKLTRLADGMTIVKEHGKTATYYPDGSAVVRYANGKVRVEAPTVVARLRRWLKELF
ncbi:MAG TPA: hypothetical protein V6D08_17305 [Candidatus Obscuribacterales bacterium]